jgi:uncharacterized membrane protein
MATNLEYPNVHTLTIRAVRVVFGIAASLAMMHCAPARVPVVPAVRLVFAGTPQDARVTVDDVARGTLATVAATGVFVAPGMHRISVEADGHFPYDVVVNVTARTKPNQVAIPVKLQQLPE